jgi:hypothetical protein
MELASLQSHKFVRLPCCYFTLKRKDDNVDNFMRVCNRITSIGLQNLIKIRSEFLQLISIDTHDRLVRAYARKLQSHYCFIPKSCFSYEGSIFSFTCVLIRAYWVCLHGCKASTKIILYIPSVSLTHVKLGGILMDFLEIWYWGGGGRQVPELTPPWKQPTLGRNSLEDLHVFLSSVGWWRHHGGFPVTPVRLAVDSPPSRFRSLTQAVSDKWAAILGLVIW